MYRITKKFGPFAAMHFLTTVPEGHQCGREHGHNYEIEIDLAARELNERGFVVDYGDLKPFEEYANARMDHRNINAEFDFPTTAENLARHFFDWIQGTQSWPVVAVRVSETPGKTVSEYSRPLSTNVADLHVCFEVAVNHKIKFPRF
jgi:6-pyruvoyltetrahydropterin/6-carboxytetrahydropterin synthase